MSRSRPANLDAHVFAEQVQYLYSNAQRSIPFNVVNPGILLLVFWPVAEHASLLAWFGSLAALTAVRFVHVRRALAKSRFGRNPESLARQFTTGATATALLWGGGYMIVGAPLAPPYQMLYLLTLGGMAAGAFTSIGTHRGCYLLFLTGLFMPVLGTLTFQATHLTAAVGVLVILFVSMLAVTHKVTYQMLVSSIHNKLENEMLVGQLEQANSKLEAVNEELGVRAEMDALTGIFNRRHFEHRLTVEWQRARRKKECLTCLMIDVDYFKQFNDHYGHRAGDDCLKRIAVVLAEHAKRSADMVARYGGEEFVILLPDTELEGAQAIAEKSNKAVRELAIPHDQSSASRYVTVSIGVAAATPDRLSNKHALLEAADEALYLAKQQGRNQVVVSRGTQLDAVYTQTS